MWRGQTAQRQTGLASNPNLHLRYQIRWFIRARGGAAGGELGPSLRVKGRDRMPGEKSCESGMIKHRRSNRTSVKVILAPRKKDSHVWEERVFTKQ